MVPYAGQAERKGLAAEAQVSLQHALLLIMALAADLLHLIEVSPVPLFFVGDGSGHSCSGHVTGKIYGRMPGDKCSAENGLFVLIERSFKTDAPSLPHSFYHKRRFTGGEK